jgi:hypothetical protein
MAQAKKQDLIMAEKFAAAELYHLMSFSDGVTSTDHLIRVVELENDSRAIVKKLAKLESRD